MTRKAMVHPTHYYTIRDAIIAEMGPKFDQTTFNQRFSKAARPHNVIPFTDGYLTHRRIIGDLVRDKMRRARAAAPKDQLTLI